MIVPARLNPFPRWIAAPRSKGIPPITASSPTPELILLAISSTDVCGRRADATGLVIPTSDTREWDLKIRNRNESFEPLAPKKPSVIDLGGFACDAPSVLQLRPSATATAADPTRFRPATSSPASFGNRAKLK